MCAWTCTDTGLSVSECSQRSRRVAGVLVMVGRYLLGVAQASGAMHVARVVGRYTAKSGEHREYVSHLLRRTFRADGKVRHETLANLSPLPAAAIEAVRASLAGKTLLVAGEDLEVTRSLPHGHVAAVLAQAQRLGLPNLLGPVGRQRDVAVRQRARYLQVLPGDQQRLAGQARPDRLDRCRGQRREVRQRLVPDLAVGAKRAPQQVRDVLPVLPGLGRVPTHHPGYVHRTGGLSHTQQDNGPPSLGPRRHADFAGYTRKHSGRYPCRSKHRSLLSGVVTSAYGWGLACHGGRWRGAGTARPPTRQGRCGRCRTGCPGPAASNPHDLARSQLCRSPTPRSAASRRLI